MIESHTIVQKYRNWILHEALEEARSNCARLKKISDDMPMFFVELTNNWTADDRFDLMRACVKRRFRAPPAEFSEREIMLLAMFPQDASGWSELGRYSLALAHGEFACDKTRIRRAVRARLRPILGQEYRKDGIRFVTHLEDVTVYTDVRIGGRLGRQLSYDQMILAGRVDENMGYVSPEVVLCPATFMDVIGICPTRWSYMNDDDVPGAVDLLADMCVGFIDAVPSLIRTSA